MQGAKMDMKNFILPFQNDNGDECIAYIPQPTPEELRQIAGILGFLLPKVQGSELDFIVFVQDWELMLEKYYKKQARDGEDINNIKADLMRFLDRKIEVGNCFDMKGNILQELSADERNFISGELLFFCCLYRYAKIAFKQKEMKDLTTSLTSSAYQEYLKKQHGGQSMNAEQKRLPNTL